MKILRLPIIVLLGITSTTLAEQKPQSVHQQKNTQLQLDFLRMKERQAKAQQERDAKEVELDNFWKSQERPRIDTPEVSRSEEAELIVARLAYFERRLAVGLTLKAEDVKWLLTLNGLAVTEGSAYAKYQPVILRIAKANRALQPESESSKK